MKKNIFILNHYAGSPNRGQWLRHYNFAKYLQIEGYNTIIFAADRLNTNDSIIDLNGKLFIKKIENDIPYVYIKTSAYEANGISRVMNMVTYYFNVIKAAKQYAKVYGKPDVIYASSVHPLAIVAGIQLAKYFHVECIGEVRDLWPLSIVEYSNKFTEKNLLIKMLFQGEKWIYKRCNKLIFTIEGGYDYIIDRGWEKAIPKEKVYHINNGVDLEVFNYDKEHHEIQDEDLEKDDIFKVIYTGSIRKANNLELLVDAAQHISIINKNIKILIWGDGDFKEQLEHKCKQLELNNIVFKGKVNKKFIPDIVSRADLNILNYTQHDIWKYGGSQNKVFEYLAAGKPILCTISMGYDIITKYNAGLSSQSQTSESIGDSIIKIAGLPEYDYNEISENALKASKDFDFKNLTKKLISCIED